MSSPRIRYASVSSTVGVPPVDPLAKRGAFHSAYTRFMRTKAGRWVGINVASRVDPALLKLTRGYVGMGLMLPSVNLTTTGAKSGQPRTTTVLYFSDGDDVILVPSSFGRVKHPAWYYNLKANPEATLETRGRSGRYIATEVDDAAERARLFSLVDRIYAGYADYRVRAAETGRVIPIMRLKQV
jgi:deazaflavin-dependent oxidoreductase (nitroreductase family)